MIRIAVIAVVLRLSCDIGVCIHDLKVRAVVVSTWREWRHRIDPYVQKRLVTEKLENLRKDEVFEQFAKIQNREAKESDEPEAEKTHTHTRRPPGGWHGPSWALLGPV